VAWRASTGPYEPEVWLDPSPLPRLEGIISPNRVLEGAEHLYLDELIGPESIAFAQGETYLR
jgi:hypothetical protein